MGKLIVIEGLDGSGKSTQMKNLIAYLEEKNRPYRQIKLPDYDDPSSTLVRMYLSGEFGDKPDDVGAYAASSFYAVDRYAGFKRHWGADYENGALILADRYTTSNAVHQCSKLPREKWDGYLEWLYDYEFNLLGIPKPDLVIYLDMKPEVSQKLLSKRYSGNDAKKDIHERDVSYLEHCRVAAKYAADKLGWSVISCDDGVNPYSPERIFKNIKQQLDKLLEEI
jgi:dTMP kinase